MSKPGRKPDPARATAEMLGDKTFIGKECWCGNTIRYTNGMRCVECARSESKRKHAEKQANKSA